MLVPRTRFAQNVDQAYRRADHQYHQAAEEMVRSNPKFRVFIENWLNQQLERLCAAAVDRAVPNKTLVVEFSADTSKLAQSLIRSMPSKAQARVDPHLIRVAIELILEAGEYVIENGTLIYEHHIIPDPPDVEDEPEADETPSGSDGIEEGTGSDEAPEDDTSEEGTADPGEGATTALTASTPTPAPEPEPEPEPEPDSLPATREGLVVGGRYGNGGSIVREILEMKGSKVKYVVIEGHGPVKEGSEGSCSYKSFLGWCKEIIDVPDSPEDGEE